MPRLVWNFFKYSKEQIENLWRGAGARAPLDHHIGSRLGVHEKKISLEQGKFKNSAVFSTHQGRNIFYDNLKCFQRIIFDFVSFVSKRLLKNAAWIATVFHIPQNRYSKFARSQHGTSLPFICGWN